jgi:hypothetical protein
MAFTLLQPLEGTLNTNALNPPSTWNAFVESAVKSRRDMCEILHTIKNMFNLDGENINVWNDVTEAAKFIPHFRQIQEKIKDLEKKTATVDWKYKKR